MGANLTRRVQQNTNAPASTGESRPATISQQIQQMEQSFKLAMPRGAEATQLIRDALTCLRMTPKLQQCDPQTVLGALMTCAQLGLRPGVLGHAWLLPFYDNRSKSHKAQLVIGYQGLVELAHRSGRIKSLIARTVFSNDTFEVEYGLDDNLIHRPALGHRGDPIAYYAVAKFTEGGHAFLVMTHEEMEDHRDRYAMAKNRDGQVVGPWRDQFEGMAHKTCVRQLAKWMPKSTDYASAIEADGSVRVDLTPQPDALLHGEHPRPDDIDGEIVEDEPVGADEPDNSVPMATQAQLTKLHTQLSKLGVDDREKPRILALLAKREIASSKDLTKEEITGIIDLLEEMLGQDDPAGVLQSTLAQLSEANV
ncbi:recombination protein RecT [Amycolatopsis sp. NPDC004368]